MPPGPEPVEPATADERPADGGDAGGPRPPRFSSALSVFHNASLAVGPTRGLMYAVCSLALVAAVLETAMLFLIARLASSFTNGNQTIELSVGSFGQWEVSIRQIVLIAGGLLFLELLLVVPLSVMTARLSSNALTRARDRVITAHMRAAWSHRSREVEDHLHRLMGDDANHVERLVQQWSTIVVSLSGIVMLAVAAVVIAPVPALCGTAAFGVLVLALRPMSRRVKRAAARFQASNRELMTNVAQTSRLDKEIAAFEVGEAVKSTLAADVALSSRMLNRLRFNQRATPMLYLDSSLALVLAGIAILSALDVGSVDYLGPLILLMVRALGYTRQLQSAAQNSHEMAPYITDLEREIASFEKVQRPAGTEPLANIGMIEVQDMSFAYIENRPILRDVNLRFGFAEIIGLVGDSGAGKTTFTELILRLRQPSSGRITVSGIDISSVDPTEWSKLVSYVPQDNSLIRATVADNIAFYRSGFDRSEIERSAKQAHLHDEIMAMPLGYDTMVGPGERSLSGGQRQRLGIARALLGRPQLLVLDEPTSALDERSELLIKQTLSELKGSVTMIVVAHRPTTLEVCSKILRLSGGDIEEISLLPTAPKGPDEP
ncbi:MAG: ABC transporter ATP-binding protein [Actinobacteria bacterium]|nr:ABC transporter ATP-binding protein [Actinomycetota bacterium]